MFVYWGGPDSGKGHMIKYAQLNNKPFLKWKEYSIVKQIPTLNVLGQNDDGRFWWDKTDIEQIYHKRCDEIFVRKTEWTTHKVCPLYVNRTDYNFCNPEYNKNADEDWLHDRKIFSEKYIKKYTQKEYIGTHIYHHMISRAKGVGFTVANSVLDPITPTKCPQLPLHEIMDDVELSFLFVHTDGNYDADIIELSDYLKGCDNIIPYKSNILDTVTTKLDKMGHLGFELNKNNVLDVYNDNKEKLWSYVDRFFDFITNMKNILESNNIPYRMFDLDNDDYKDTFGWENYPIDRNLSHPKQIIYNDLQNEKWKVLEDLAKEYIMDRGL